MAYGATDNTKNPGSNRCVAEDPLQEFKLLNRQVATANNNH
jgi:hypothetical protein